MRLRTSLALSFALMAPGAALAQDTLPPGIWTNTEDASFAGEEGRARPEQVLLEVGPDGRWRMIDAFGAPQGEWRSGPIPGLAQRESGSGWQISGSEIRRAQAFSCWFSVRKHAAKPDGSPDWSFTSGLRTFDQGGRVAIPGAGQAPDVTVRLRNVTWARGSTNKPSLVLYVHKDDPDRAESYSWASPDANLIGINLRWMQGSCGREQAPASANNSDRQALLAAAGQRWQEAYEARDWARLRGLYTDDAVLMTQGQPKIVGADKIVAFLQRIPNAGGSVQFRFANEEVTLDPGGHGTVTAKYRMDIAFPGREPVIVAGRSLLIYRWQDGEWKLWRDIDNLAPDVTPADFPQ